VHRGGNLFVRKLLENSQCDGHRLTARQAMNGRENLVAHLPTGQFEPGWLRAVDRLVTMLGRLPLAIVAGATAGDAVRGVDVYLEYGAGRAARLGNRSPPFPPRQRRVLLSFFATLRFRGTPPHRADHAILDWLDEPFVEVVRRLH